MASAFIPARGADRFHVACRLRAFGPGRVPLWREILRPCPAPWGKRAVSHICHGQRLWRRMEPLREFVFSGSGRAVCARGWMRGQGKKMQENRISHPNPVGGARGSRWPYGPGGVERSNSISTGKCPGRKPAVTGPGAGYHSGRRYEEEGESWEVARTAAPARLRPRPA